MNKTIRLIAVFISGFVLLSFGILVVNQTAQVVQLAKSVNPALGTATLWVLLATEAGLVAVPVVMFFRLPKPLTPPASEQDLEFEPHLRRLAGRLAQSPHLSGRDLSDRPAIEDALGVLSGQTDTVIRQTASAIFVATAVSQSGRLDAILVLAAQTRMIWRIAHIYHQRPAVRDILHLYANVAATAFLAGELEDLDLGQQVEPVLSSATGALLGTAVPGLKVPMEILAKCALDGSANAFLTLRVGMIAKRSCAALVVEPRASLRRAATIEAAQHLGAIVAEGSGKISKAVWRVSKEKVGGAVSGFSGSAKEAAAKAFAKVWGSWNREQPEAAV
jgi:hypothetical protein